MNALQRFVMQLGVVALILAGLVRAPSRAEALEQRVEAVAAETPQTSECRRLREGDEFWQLSTRHLCGAATSEVVGAIAVHQIVWENGQTTWQASTLDAFAQDARDIVTVVFVHGNRASADEAVAQGWRVYDALAAEGAPAVRLAVWSWPSEQIRGPRRDVQSKAARAGAEAHYLGAVLRRLHTPRRVGILGYSFGAKITTGGVHLAAGGTLDGQSIESPPLGEQRFGIVLAAAAEHNHWVMPESLHGKALERVDHLFNLYNTCDPVLSRYRWIDRCERPQALGHVGIAAESLGSYADRVTQRDAATAIGRTHDFYQYAFVGMPAEELRRYLLSSDASKE